MKKLILSSAMILSMLTTSAQWSAGTLFTPTFRFGNTGIGTAAPTFPLEITPAGTSAAANAQGWRRGILLNASSTLYWQSAGITANNYFMGHASSSPAGDFYQGWSVGIGPAAPVTYTSKVFVSSAPAFMPAGSTQIFKNLLVQETGFNRRLGVNLLNPKRTADFLFAGAPQLRLTHTQNALTILGIYTDFETTSAGHMIIRPRNGLLARNVGIDVSTAPTQKLDVQGNARLRSVPTATNNYLMTGTISGGPNDITFSKLAFTGSATQVLLGNGTWGTLSATASANNGLSTSGTFVQLGQVCNDPLMPATLLNNREIPMANNNIYFTGQGVPTTNSIGLGYPACTPMPAKFNTRQQNTAPVIVSTIAGSFINRDQVAGGASAIITAVSAISNQTQTGNNTNTGGDFLAGNAPINIAVSANAAAGPGSSSSTAGQFVASNATPGINQGVVCRVSSGSSNYGVQSVAAGGVNSYGVSTVGTSGSNTNYGVQTTAGGGINSYGIYSSNGGTAPNHWAGWFQGDVNVSGTGYITSGVWMVSDNRYKKDIKKIESVSDKLQKLTGYTYNFRKEEFPDKNFDSKEQIGLIAQELKEVFPQLVRETGDGYYAVNYQGMIPVLVEAFKEQKKETEELKALVQKLTELNSEDATGSTGKRSSTVELSDAQAIVLEQNVPNPFAEQTVISYTLTDGVKKAQILFYNMDGKLINSSDLKPLAGKGVLNVFANDLSNGIYSYTLVVDDKIIETKRMVKSK